MMMARAGFALFLAVAALVLAVPALAGDPDYLQDICVADLKSDLKVNGFPCKANATADDFFTGVLAKPGATNTTAGSVVTGANVEKLFAKTISQGDVFAFPRGLVHFQKNNADKPAAVISAFNSQLPGTQSIAMTLFGASPEVTDDVLAKAFQIGTVEVDKIKAKFAPKK
uniref:Germin-like protein n=1 Tax=Aegilops tauschii TaxID=37682 RepID=N1QSJ8_AEGTA